MFLYKCSITHDPGSLGARVAITDLMQGLVLMYRVRRQIRVSYLFVTCLFRPLRVLARVEIRYKYSIVDSQSLCDLMDQASLKLWTHSIQTSSSSHMKFGAKRSWACQSDNAGASRGGPARHT